MEKNYDIKNEQNLDFKQDRKDGAEVKGQSQLGERGAKPGTARATPAVPERVVPGRAP